MKAPTDGASEPEKRSRGRPKKSIVAGLKGDLMTVHIQFPTSDVERIDAFAAQKRLSRSSLIRAIVIEHLQAANFLNQVPTPAADAFSKFWENMTPNQQAAWLKWSSEAPIPPDEK